MQENYYMRIVLCEEAENSELDESPGPYPPNPVGVMVCELRIGSYFRATNLASTSYSPGERRGGVTNHELSQCNPN